MQTSRSRRRLIQAAALAPLAGLGPARAQSAFPTKPLRFIVPYPPGGSVDVGIRALTEVLHGLLHPSIVVENKPGGVFTVSINSLAQGPADGHSLLATNASFVSSQLVQKRYDMVAQLTSVTTWSKVDTILTISPTAPFDSVAAMIAWARANPRRLSYGAAGGPGSLEHLKMVEMSRRHGFEGIVIPYKGGPDAMIALASGEIDVFLAVVPLVNQYADRVRPLAVIGDQRSPHFPNLPTLKELGIELAPFLYWNGLSVAPATPPQTIDILRKAITQALLSKELAEKFATIGMTPFPSTPDELNRIIASDLRTFGELVTQAGLSPA